VYCESIGSKQIETAMWEFVTWHLTRFVLVQLILSTQLTVTSTLSPPVHPFLYQNILSATKPSSQKMMPKLNK
jgi:hypothetical protein